MCFSNSKMIRTFTNVLHAGRDDMFCVDTHGHLNVWINTGAQGVFNGVWTGSTLPILSSKGPQARIGIGDINGDGNPMRA